MTSAPRPSRAEDAALLTAVACKAQRHWGNPDGRVTVWRNPSRASAKDANEHLYEVLLAAVKAAGSRGLQRTIPKMHVKFPLSPS